MKLLILALCALVACTYAVPESRQVLWTRTAYPRQWIKGERADLDETTSFVIALKQQNLDVLDKVFWAVSEPDSPQYQNFMAYPEIMDIIAPPKEHHRFVMDWVREQGCAVKDRGDNLLVTGTVEVVENMFRTKLYHFQHHKRPSSIIRQMGAYSLPVEVAHYVYMVAGLSDFPMIDVMPKVGAGRDGVVPDTLVGQYNIPASATAGDTSQGVIEFGRGQYFSESDLKTFGTKVDRDIPALDKDHIVNPQPPVGVEGTLDIQYIAGLAANSSNWYWTENNWLYEWATSFAAASKKPDIVSISYGWSEANQCDIAGNECQVLGVDSEQYVARVNTEFQKIGVQGVSILSASGDSGANGRTDPTCSQPKLKPTFPGASPYLTAVGATQLVNPDKPLSKSPPACQEYSCNYGGQETAVSFQESHFTSGGGFSDYAPRPSYQDSAVKTYLSSGVELPPASYFNQSNRGYPDVSSIGHNVLIYSESMGGVQPVGGTSASSPSFAAYMSLLNAVSKQKTNGKPLGFLNPLLYKMASESPDTFTSITVGDNKCTESGCRSECKGFMCHQGWDPVTGLGVPNVEKMLGYIRTM